MTTVGEALIGLLESYGVDTVFGIPGVHTIELYRGLARSSIRHVTPRHEQGAGFMADGYARVSGKPGVAFVITGPGLTNAITAMGQARADSIPMLVISGVNQTHTLSKGLGYLHELPDQRGMMRTVALMSERIETVDDLASVMQHAFALFESGRPGPVHIEIPLDIMGQVVGCIPVARKPTRQPTPEILAVEAAAALIAGSSRPVILAGGGAKNTGQGLRALAERLDAPVVTTVNGRGLLYRHPLGVAASPTLEAVRNLITAADLVIAIGTELGPTDYDLNAVGGWSTPATLIRIDIDRAQLARHPHTVGIKADSGAGIDALMAAVIASRAPGDGARRAQTAREAAFIEIGPAMQAQVAMVEAIRDALPQSIIVGDSTQPVYAANLYYDHDRAGGWFNAATGFGALGYGPPAAIGASLAAPGAAVVCLCGDGGFQFTMAELGTAADAGTPVIFVVWNNRGYREIETSMRDAGVEPVGVSPAPPDFLKLAGAYGIDAVRLASADGLPEALRAARASAKPWLIEIVAD